MTFIFLKIRIVFKLNIFTKSMYLSSCINMIIYILNLIKISQNNLLVHLLLNLNQLKYLVFKYIHLLMIIILNLNFILLLIQFQFSILLNFNHLYFLIFILNSILILYLNHFDLSMVFIKILNDYIKSMELNSLIYFYIIS